MKIFGNKKIEKEINIARSPEEEIPQKSFSVLKFYLMLWNIVSMAMYCIYIFYLILTSPVVNLLTKIIVIILYIYLAAFVLILVISLGDKDKLKSRMKNYKSAVKFLKYFIQIISFTLAIVTGISSFLATGKFDKVSFTSAFSSMIVTVIMVIFEILKILVRRNIPIFKHNFLTIREVNEEIHNEKIREKEKIKADKEAFKIAKRNGGRYQLKLDSDVVEEDTTEDISAKSDSTNEKIEKEIEKDIDENVSDEILLSENEDYDEEAGVIISYDDSDENSDNDAGYDKKSLLKSLKNIFKNNKK